jgi:hypothetical protein
MKADPFVQKGVSLEESKREEFEVHDTIYKDTDQEVGKEEIEEEKKKPPKIPLMTILTDRRIIRFFIVTVGFIFGVMLIFTFYVRMEDRDMWERDLRNKDRAEWLASVKNEFANYREKVLEDEEVIREIASREIDHDLLGRMCTVHNQIFEIVWVYIFDNDVWFGCMGQDGALYENKAMDVFLLPSQQARAARRADLPEVPRK